MAGSTFGKHLTITTFGESHGPCIGVVIDGVPAGLSIKEEDFNSDLKRRAPKDPSSTKRKEPDNVKILSGVFESKSTGTPIAIIVENSNFSDRDYDEYKDIFRPSHADFTYYEKYGIRDHNGGGRSSGRETVARVLAGVIAKKILSLLDITFDTTYVFRQDIPAGDSVGGKVTVNVTNVPSGIGEPVFDKLDALLAHSVMSIGAVKAVEIGNGIKASENLGSENNDEFIVKNGKTTAKTNNAGGILGGISSSAPIVLTATIKPTPSISLKQNTVDINGNAKVIEVKGRHDSCIVPRVAPVIEAMMAITLADLLLINMSSKAENILKIYKGENNE